MKTNKLNTINQKSEKHKHKFENTTRGNNTHKSNTTQQIENKHNNI